VQNLNDQRNRAVRAAECVTNEMFASEKLKIILMCVPLMVSILRSKEHIRDFGRSSVQPYINFSYTIYS
jgi:hypothetical protein